MLFCQISGLVCAAFTMFDAIHTLRSFLLTLFAAARVTDTRMKKWKVMEKLFAAQSVNEWQTFFWKKNEP